MAVVGMFGHFWVLKSSFEQKIIVFSFLRACLNLKKFQKTRGAIGRHVLLAQRAQRAL